MDIKNKALLIVSLLGALMAGYFLFQGFALSGALLLSSFAVLYFSVSGLSGQLENYAQQHELAKKEIEQAQKELKLRVEERTTELAQANVSLNEQHIFLQTIIESLTQPFYVIDAVSYRIVLANKAAYPGTVLPEGMTCYAMTHSRKEPCTGADHPCSLAEVIKKKQPVILEHLHLGKDGKDRVYEIYAYPIMDNEDRVKQIIEYCVDITERKKAEEENKKISGQIIQLQKMEAIGTLAGGIAHDFNNILTAIIGFAELARYKALQGSDIRTMLDRVIDAGVRAKDLVQQILSFSRQAEQNRKPVEIQQIVKEALKLIRASIPTTIEIRQNIDDRCGAVLADPTQIHQVVMNLCTNAYHAMREKGGILGVSLKPVKIDRDVNTSSSLLLRPGDYLKLEISDTGHGMEHSVLKRIFEPYFTTKEQGQGTGMGLAVVHGIVKSHGGHITVYSEPNLGTTFHVYIPKLIAPAIGPATEACEEIPPEFEALPRGHERILLVDDEEQISLMEQEVLQSLGYTVEAFTDSPGAFQAFQACPDKFDMVLTDMTMPKMTGAELSRKILAIRHDIPIILCTGFSELINAEKAKELGIREYVMKPILISEIALIIRKVFDSGRQTAR